MMSSQLVVVLYRNDCVDVHETWTENSSKNLVYEKNLEIVNHFLNCFIFKF